MSHFPRITEPMWTDCGSRAGLSLTHKMHKTPAIVIQTRLFTKKLDARLHQLFRTRTITVSPPPDAFWKNMDRYLEKKINDQLSILNEQK